MNQHHNKHRRPENVLVVNNNDTLQEFYKDAFIRHGYRVDVVRSSEEAERLPRGDAHYDCVILDLSNPAIIEQNLRALRKKDPDLKSIVVTPPDPLFGQTDLTSRLRDKGVVKFLEWNANPYDIARDFKEYLNTKK